MVGRGSEPRWVPGQSSVRKLAIARLWTQGVCGIAFLGSGKDNKEIPIRAGHAAVV